MSPDSYQKLVLYLLTYSL